ncbi:hypothetical protein ALPR1_13650 [Algoriphagus machipongonensis]|uniref:Uncharacterized protein n=1 Tax=Algoriphagus machipongonensis TaxID=388413 RepID=A3HTV1_9BACT|nr:hypothetical protein ALPR1_13650 [Algoriphagus machipongonensis]
MAPNFSRCNNRITGDNINVLIDHFLVSQVLQIIGRKTWNPYLEKDKVLIQDIRILLIYGSDYFTIYLK